MQRRSDTLGLSSGCADYNARVTRLFERQTVAAIRETEKSKRQEISAKQDEMRDTVGARYRDIIESADSIAEMKSCCGEIMSAVGSMNGRCAGLQDAVREASATAGGGTQHSELGKLVAVGTQVKFVLDTPSHIFDSLAKSSTLDATIRFHSAAGVYSDLQGSAGDLLALFPWLGAHWEEVQGCRCNIADSCRSQLATTGLKSAEYAESLASLMLVERASALDALGLLLDAAKRWVERSVAELRGTDGAVGMKGLTTGVERLGEGLASALCLVQRVFVAADAPNVEDPSNDADHTGLVMQMIQSAATAGVVGSTNDSDKTVPHELVQSKCRAWVIECQELISSDDSWLAPAERVSDLHKLSRAIASGINTAVSRVGEGSQDFTWGYVWDSTLGNNSGGAGSQPTDVWASVFRSPFYARSQQIVTAALDLTRFHEEHVKPWLAQLDGPGTAAQHNGMASIGSYMWAHQRASMSQVDALVHGDASVGEGALLLSGKAAIKGRTEDVEALRVAFERQLEQTSADASVDGGDGDGVTGSALPDLRPVLQEICETAIGSWLKTIESIVAKLCEDVAQLDFSSPSPTGFSSSLLQRYPALRVAVALSRLLAAVAESELLACMLAGTNQATGHLGAAIREQALASMHVWVVSFQMIYLVLYALHFCIGLISLLWRGRMRLWVVLQSPLMGLAQPLGAPCTLSNDAAGKRFQLVVKLVRKTMATWKCSSCRVLALRSSFSSCSLLPESYIAAGAMLSNGLCSTLSGSAVVKHWSRLLRRQLLRLNRSAEKKKA